MRTSSGLPRTLGVALALLAGCAAATAPARAAVVTDAQAEQLEQQIRAWLADLLGAQAPLPDRPVEITAQDDHFHIAVPLDEAFGGGPVTATGEPVTADVRPLDNGRWALDHIAFPSPLRVTYPMAQGGRTTVTFSSDEQTQSAVLDPSLATGSNWDSTIKGYATRSEGMQGTQSTRIEQMVNHLSWQPAADGRINLLQEVDGSLLTINSMAPKVGLVAFSAERLRGSVHMDNVLPDRIRPILHAMFDLAPVAMAAADEKTQMPTVERPGKPPDKTKAKPAVARHDSFRLPPAARASLREALTAARDLTDGFGEQVSMDNLHLETAGHAGHAARMEAGMGIAAPGGLLTLRLNFVLDGLDSPEIPPGVYRDYLPRHIAFAPRVGGLSGKDLIDLLIRAVDSDGADPVLQAQAEDLLQKGPITVGLDDLALDFGPVALKGAGAMQIASRQSYTGEAHFSATGMDEMIRRAGGTPELQQAVPVLILLKGIGQQEGDKMVWNISYQGGKIMVNGNDLSQMIPGH
jgi:hypothetical protein